MIAKKRIKRPKIDQLTFDRHQWGGTRPGAGRKKDARAGVSHARREELDPHHPVHVTLRIVQGLRTLRSGLPYHVLRLAFAKGHARDRLPRRALQRAEQPHAPDRRSQGPSELVARYASVAGPSRAQLECKGSDPEGSCPNAPVCSCVTHGPSG